MNIGSFNFDLIIRSEFDLIFKNKIVKNLQSTPENSRGLHKNRNSHSCK